MDITEFPYLLEYLGSSPRILVQPTQEKLNNGEKIETYNPSISQPPNPIPHSILDFLQVLFPWGNSIHIHHFHHSISLPQPPYSCFPQKNGVLLPNRFFKPISGFCFRRLQMYLVINLPHQITTLGGVLLLTESPMTSHILKCTVSPPCLLMRLHDPQICSLILFWQPLIP